MARKIIGWTISFQRNGVVYLVTVKADSKDDAIKLFALLGYIDVEARAIQHTCIIQAPGPVDIQGWEEYAFEECISAAEAYS